MSGLFAVGGQESYAGNTEPCLTAMLTDPVFLAVLRRDGLTIGDLFTQLGLPKKWARRNGKLRAPTMAAA